ncbi:hypothetical protein CORC01_03164 [Colletotrichum orchidophilum]|uniref:MMS19 nucleotide excision repair protein n=1 Tax=Colletotrichum orchidophilum TaxID=1209926 RepID=A0A1G4BJD3_9PEZI|nr:uncharacterized protein CORC01_03164 [Colletotrichum orchidophilum]OHF01408.1 hypothetical protein CORC01_03164 [Colletotrichum orchidophilum]
MLSGVVKAMQQADLGSVEFNVDRGLPERYTLADLTQDFLEGNILPQLDALSALSLCLRNTERIDQESQDQASIQHLSSQTLGLLSHSSGSLLNIDPASAEQALDVLKILVLGFSLVLGDQNLIVVAAYTDCREAWTTVNAELYAREILGHSMDSDQKHAFINSAVLERFIRPIFSRTCSSRITSTGRKAHFADDSQDGFASNVISVTDDARLWKTTQTHAVTVFSWAVEQCDDALAGKSWPMFTPVLLALLDDPDTKFKAKGLSVLSDFLAKCPAKVLVETGLGSIFEQSLFPCLLSLPTLTPEKESLQLLGPAYSAIIQLAKMQFPEAKARDKKNKLLTRLLREGILPGYWQSSEYVEIVELLARQTISIVNELGFFATTHLKAIPQVFSVITQLLTFA